jgi:hypothetical protein
MIEEYERVSADAIFSCPPFHTFPPPPQIHGAISKELAKYATFSVPFSPGFNDGGGVGGVVEVPAAAEEEIPPGAVLAPEVEVEAGLLPLPEVHLFPTEKPEEGAAAAPTDDDMPELEEDSDGEVTMLEEGAPELLHEDAEGSFLEEWAPDWDNLPATGAPPESPPPPPPTEPTPPPTPVPKEWQTLYSIFNRLPSAVGGFLAGGGGGGDDDDDDSISDDSVPDTPTRKPPKRRGEAVEEHEPVKKPALDDDGGSSDTEVQMEALRK